MPRYIDADVILTKFDKVLQLAGNDGAIAALKVCKKIVQKAPTISPDEVRGVVHCHECVHADKDLPGAIYCTMWDAWEVPENGFCYKGARMKGAEDGTTD